MSQEFLNGWTAAERDDLEGNAERVAFPSYRTDDFIAGYQGFYAKQREEVAAAERECIGDYDAARG